MKDQEMAEVAPDAALPQWHPSMRLFRGVSHALCDEGPRTDPPPLEMSLCGVESQKHAPFFTSVTVAVVTFLFLFLARLLSFRSTHEAY